MLIEAEYLQTYNILLSSFIWIYNKTISILFHGAVICQSTTAARAYCAPKKLMPLRKGFSTLLAKMAGFPNSIGCLPLLIQSWLQYEVNCWGGAYKTKIQVIWKMPDKFTIIMNNNYKSKPQRIESSFHS